MKIKKNDWLTTTLWVGLVLLILFDIVIVLRGSLEAFHSDSATAILLAKEQLRTGQIIPDGWYYANDIWLISLNLFCIPFLLFIEDWMLCRQLAVILQLLVVTVVFLQYVRKIINLRWALAAAILFWCPLSVTVREHFLYQATYATGMLETLLILWASHGFYKAEKTREIIVYGVVVALLTIIMAVTGIRFIGATALPIVGAVGLLLLFDVDFDLTKFTDRKNVMLIAKLVWFLGMCALGYFIHLRIRSNGAISEFGMVFIERQQIMDKLSELIQSYLAIWGCLDAFQVLSVQGIIAFCGLIVCIVMNLIVPIYLVVRYSKIKNREARFFILYSGLCWCVCCYLVTFTNMYNPYYLLPIFFNDCILSAIAMDDLFTYNKNLVVCVTVLCLVPFCVVTGAYWATRNYSKCEKDYELINILEENELYFGCTGIFWDAYRYTVLSDGKVEIVSYEGEPEKPQLWLCSEKWYEAEYYEGRSFILIRNNWQDITEEWKARAEEILHYEDFTIYIYSENIYKIIDDQSHK